MRRLGPLERVVMDALWNMSAEAPEAAFTAREVAEHSPGHAYTTILTVLDRLARKGVVRRLRDGRSHHYLATGTRESYVAELMHDALAATDNRVAALVRFAESVSPSEGVLLREVLERLEAASNGEVPSC